ncbi:uncharacterized protein LOC18422017 [Amborella trichopoda]|uniref:uncharacterized protein LOC18422017 n=1 Tax=Amborella trichopoda TaxID=13333 RepID=UPI0005D327ED|nr:uncharacterized protein LOC18422017 [Amborella trichopoda]|eukprot:XP_011622389.1 uncharacterized protein LOC18422017 [Amborella trichopoda]
MTDLDCSMPWFWIFLGFPRNGEIQIPDPALNDLILKAHHYYSESTCDDFKEKEKLFLKEMEDVTRKCKGKDPVLQDPCPSSSSPWKRTGLVDESHLQEACEGLDEMPQVDPEDVEALKHVLVASACEGLDEMPQVDHQDDPINLRQQVSGLCLMEGIRDTCIVMSSSSDDNSEPEILKPNEHMEPAIVNGGFESATLKPNDQLEPSYYDNSTEHNGSNSEPKTPKSDEHIEFEHIESNHVDTDSVVPVPFKTRKCDKLPKNDLESQDQGQQSAGSRKYALRHRPFEHCTESAEPSKRRKIGPWTAKEEEVLKEGVKLMSEDNKCIPWKRILAFGRDAFNAARTTIDLKDKWVNISKKERKK